MRLEDMRLEVGLEGDYTSGMPGLKSWVLNSGKSWDRSKEAMSTSWPTGSGLTAEEDLVL